MCEWWLTICRESTLCLHISCVAMVFEAICQVLLLLWKILPQLFSFPKGVSLNLSFLQVDCLYQSKIRQWEYRYFLHNEGCRIIHHMAQQLMLALLFCKALQNSRNNFLQTSRIRFVEHRTRILQFRPLFPQQSPTQQIKTTAERSLRRKQQPPHRITTHTDLKPSESRSTIRQFQAVLSLWKQQWKMKSWVQLP